MSMGTRPTGDADCFREELKGNVRVRLHEIDGDTGKRYVVEVSAYSRLSVKSRWRRQYSAISTTIGSSSMTMATTSGQSCMMLAAAASGLSTIGARD